MSDDQSDQDRSAAAEADINGRTAVRSRPPLDRSRFGGTDHRRKPPEDDAPVSRSDLSKGPEELLEDRSARINWQVLVISSLVIIAFSAWAILTRSRASVIAVSSAALQRRSRGPSAVRSGGCGLSCG